MKEILKGALLDPAVIRGKSAYEIAVMHGFDGTEEEWVDSLTEQTKKNAEDVIAEADAAIERMNAASEAAIERMNAASEAAEENVANAEEEAVEHIESMAEEALNIVQTTGDSETAVMSQAAATRELTQLSEEIDILRVNDGVHKSWFTGSINSTTGVIQTSATRIRTSWFIRGGVMHIEPCEGYKYMLFAYSKEGGSFVGIWNGTEIGNTPTWIFTPSNVTPITRDYLFKVVLAKTNDESISPDDGANLKLIYATDSSFMKEGASADAKAVGVYTESYTSNGIVDLCKFSENGDYQNNGVTFVRNFDDSWTINGTASANTLCTVLRNYPVEGDRVFYIETTAAARLYWKLADGGEEIIDIVTRKYVKSPKNAVSLTYGFYARYGDTFDGVRANCKFLTVPMNELNRGVLSPSGDSTDRTEDVEFMLQTYGECRLMAGDYYIRDVHVPDGSIVSGCGRSTRVYLYGDGAGNCFVLGSGCTIKDVELVDPYNESVIVPAKDNGRNGILFEGSTTKKGTITNCHIRNFNGSGIKLVGTGVATMNGMNISDCDIENCYYGINIASESEFHRITNVSMTQNRFGCANNGGNNQFACCGFNSNMYNFVIDNSNGDKFNNSHGACVGCNFHHAASSNPKRSVMIKGSTSGYLFSGCSFDNGNVLIENSTRIVFDGCNFMKEFGLIVNGQGMYNGASEGNLIIFGNSSFRSTFESIEMSNGADRNGIKFVGCFYQDGTAVNP